MHTSVIVLTAQIHEHIEQSDHCTFTCTHQVHVNMQWSKCLTYAWESQKIRSLHTFLHTSVIGLTAQLHEHIRQSNHRDPCVWRVHVNVRVRHLAHHAHFSHTAHSPLTWTHRTVESVHVAHFHAHIGQLAHCPLAWTHQTVGSPHVYMHTSGACKHAVTQVSDVCM